MILKAHNSCLHIHYSQACRKKKLMMEKKGENGGSREDKRVAERPI